MRMADVWSRARALGIKPGRMKKKQLIRAIQRAEGNPECFDTGHIDCPEADCCWRSDCLPSRAEAR